MSDKKKLNQEEFNAKINSLLKQNDLASVAEYISEYRGCQITSNIYLSDPIYEKLSVIEVAIKFGDFNLFEVCNKRGGHHTLQNNRGFSLEYWALFHNFKLPAGLKFQYARKNQNYEGTSYEDIVLACSNGHLHVLEKLLKNNKHYPELDITTSKRNLFDYAAMFDRAEVLKVLIEISLLNAKKSIWSHRCDMGNAMHIAARLGHVRIAKVLVELLEPTSESLDERDDYEHTAMSLAVLHLQAPVVEVLAKAGATMKGEFGYKKETLFDMVFSRDSELRQEYVVSDKTMRHRVILLLAEHCPEALETLSKERLAYIEEIKQFMATHNDTVQEVVEKVEVEEDDSVLPLGPEDDNEEEAPKSEEHSSPASKKKLPECSLCDKKFTSEISLQAHLKSKGHLKQEKKERLQKKFEVVSPEKTVQKQQLMIGLIERLPLLSELINLIIAKLDKWSMLRFGATSKSIQMLVEKHALPWRKIAVFMTQELWDQSNGKIFEPVKRVMPLVENIRYRDTNSAWDLKREYLSTIFDIIKYCPNLRELDVRAIAMPIPVSFLSALFQNCPKLRVLKVTDVLIWKSSKKEAVDNGELDANQDEQPAPAVNPKKPWKKPKVKKNKKPDAKSWAVKVNEVLLNSANSLEELSLILRFNESLPPDNYAKIIVGILKKCPNLVQLRLETINWDNVQSTTMKFIVDSIFESLPKLKRLKLMGEWLFGRLLVTEYNQLFQKFNGLEKLQIEGAEIASFDRDIHDALGDCTNLKELVVCHNEAINFDGPRIGLSKLANLTKLGFYAWSTPAHDHWDHFLHTITSQCTNIQHLELALPFTERVAHGLVPIAPKLKVFKQKFWPTEVPSYAPPLIKCSNLTMFQGIKVSLSDFNTIIDHCKFLERINVEIYPSTPQEPDDNNNNGNGNGNNNNAAQPAEGANAENNNNNNGNADNADNNNNNENPDQGNNNQNNENNNEVNQNNNNAANGANNNEPNNNNNNHVIIAPAEPAWNVIDMGRILDKCRNLKSLHLNGPITNKSFTNFVVSTSLKKLLHISTDNRIVSDMVVFYLSECCPNMEICDLDYSFFVSEWIELPFTRRWPRLSRFQIRHAYNLSQTYFNANKERSSKIKYES